MFISIKDRNGNDKIINTDYIKEVRKNEEYTILITTDGANYLSVDDYDKLSKKLTDGSDKTETIASGLRNIYEILRARLH